jgi:hypothetical protein
MAYCIDNNDVAHEVRLVWTTTPPTQAGWYWVVADGSLIPIVLHVRILESGDRYNGDYNLDHVTHWLGPLPVPEPPEESRV